jgi:outer membrane protein OmpA-like peptidoglycan-associated protein
MQTMRQGANFLYSLCFRPLAITVQLCFSTMCGFSQRPASVKPMSVGDVLGQTVKLSDSVSVDNTLRFPSDRCVLLYRYRGYNWYSDNIDSVRAVEDIAQQLSMSQVFMKNMRLICYAYNEDNFLKSDNRPLVNSGRSFTAEFCLFNDRSAAQLLGSGKMILFSRDGTVLSTSAFIGNFKMPEKKESPAKMLKAKLLTAGKSHKLPLANALVYLSSSSSGDTISKTLTDNYGDFELMVPGAAGEQVLNVNPASKDIKTVIIATQEGREISTLRKTAKGFEYRFIAAEIVKLTELPTDDDLSFETSEFLRSEEKEFRRTENIEYDQSKYEIDYSSKRKLDQIGKILMASPNLRLEITSHCDARGDDVYNLQLSEKRSIAVVAYLVFIGVDRYRLKPVGKGETELRNRCHNGVDCSETEHRYNRRTEFHFTKT